MWKPQLNKSISQNSQMSGDVHKDSIEEKPEDQRALLRSCTTRLLCIEWMCVSPLFMDWCDLWQSCIIKSLVTVNITEFWTISVGHGVFSKDMGDKLTQITNVCVFAYKP